MCPKAIPLKIGPKSLRNTLMTSGPVLYAFLPLKRTRILCYVLHLLSLRRNISSLPFKIDQERCFPVQCSEGYKQWDSWHHSTVAQAWAYNVSEVFNPSFKPPTGEEDLFEAKQKYRYAVFKRMLQMG